MSNIVIKLDEKIVVGGKEVSELKARKPIMRDIKIASEQYNAAENPIAWEMLLIANLLGISETDCEELNPNIYQKIANPIKPFLV